LNVTNARDQVAEAMRAAGCGRDERTVRKWLKDKLAGL
jgi:hypothetical protein